MRLTTAAAILCWLSGPFLSAQAPIPPGHLYRGPLYITRPATPIEPQTGLPLVFTEALLRSSDRLSARVQSRTIRSVPVSGITLRVAVGPTTHGLMTFRMRPVLPDTPLPEPLRRLTPNAAPAPVHFDIVPEDPRPDLLAMSPSMRVLFTLERVEGDDGHLVFENRDAIELLWEALGKPSLSRW